MEKRRRDEIVKKVHFFSFVGDSTLLRRWFDGRSKQRVPYQWMVNLNNRITTNALISHLLFRK